MGDVIQEHRSSSSSSSVGPARKFDVIELKDTVRIQDQVGLVLSGTQRRFSVFDGGHHLTAQQAATASVGSA